MPVYSFKCDTCGRIFDKSCRFDADLSGITCPQCHGHTHKLFTPPTVIFKGSGFYINDSRSKRSNGGGSGSGD